jgi:hypothetical protein
MNRITSKPVPVSGAGSTIGRTAAPDLMNILVNALSKSGILKEDLDYHLLRAAMVIIFFFFGYQKWWAYEAQRLVPYIMPRRTRSGRSSTVYWTSSASSRVEAITSGYQALN